MSSIHPTVDANKRVKASLYPFVQNVHALHVSGVLVYLLTNEHKHTTRSYPLFDRVAYATRSNRGGRSPEGAKPKRVML